MLESAEDSNLTVTLPYGLLISWILSESQVDLFGFKATELSATYDYRTFASIGTFLLTANGTKRIL